MLRMRVALILVSVVALTFSLVLLAMPAPATNVPQHVRGANCAQCHTKEHLRWKNTLHAASAADVLLNKEHNKEELLTDECLQCHAPFQAGKYRVGDFVQPVNQKGPWRLVAKNVAAWQAIKCEVCHDVLSTTPKKLAFYDAAKQAYVPVKNSTALCEQCHQPGTDDSRNLKGSVHEGLLCTTCHFLKGSEMSLEAKRACSQCHPKVSPKHPDVTRLDTTFRAATSRNDIHFVKCATCHPKGVPARP